MSSGPLKAQNKRILSNDTNIDHKFKLNGHTQKTFFTTIFLR